MITSTTELYLSYIFEVVYGSANSERAQPSHPPPPLRHLSGIVILSVPVVGLENPFPRVGHLSILLEAVDIVPFSIFYLKMLV